MLVHNVHEAVNGKVALELLGRISPPALIFLDLMMPVMDGPTLYKELQNQKHLAHVPVVIFSANVDQVKIDGAAGHVKKPAELNDLLAYIDRFCPNELNV